MVICKNCGVELEPDMQVCPLCEEPVSVGLEKETEKPVEITNLKKPFDTRAMSRPQKKATWELVSIILVMSIIVTTLIDYIISKKITWSEYPVAICLIVFSYISVFAFVDKRRKYQLIWAFVIASALIFVLDAVTGGPEWALFLGIPLLFVSNAVFAILVTVIRRSKQRGVNLIAYYFLAAALLVLGVEIITDQYLYAQIRLVWSLIVCACTIPIAAVLFFMHYRLKKGRDLNKTFHI